MFRIPFNYSFVDFISTSFHPLSTLFPLLPSLLFLISYLPSPPVPNLLSSLLSIMPYNTPQISSWVEVVAR